MSVTRKEALLRCYTGHGFFLWMGQGLPSLQYLHFSSVTGMIDFTMCPYLRLGKPPSPTVNGLISDKTDLASSDASGASG